AHVEADQPVRPVRDGLGRELAEAVHRKRVVLHDHRVTGVLASGPPERASVVAPGTEPVAVEEDLSAQKRGELVRSGHPSWVSHHGYCKAASHASPSRRSHSGTNRKVLPVGTGVISPKTGPSTSS